MRRQTTSDSVDVTLRIPKSCYGAAMEAIRSGLESVGAPHREIDDGGEELFTVEEVFGPRSPGRILRGARTKEGLTQKELAVRTDVRQHHISEMENGKRPIGKDMARKLGDVLGVHWKVFL